jgi:hypothetical protein
MVGGGGGGQGGASGTSPGGRLMGVTAVARLGFLIVRMG